ncbi:MAG: thiol reductant ABC exporter subunit CydD, partial [Nocardioides sp.]|nr:thiol reductant ABC exporter subunit CydD [Nocardioides sp.]
MNVRELGPHLRPARGLLALAVAASIVGGLAVIGQAFAVGELVVAVATGGSLVTPAVWLVALLVVRAGCGAVVELATAASATRVGSHLRGRLLSAALTATGTRRRTGELAVLLTRGVEATGPWFTRYLPAMLLAGGLPVATLATITWLDPWSGLIVLLTLPLVPLFAALVGIATRDKARAQWRLMGSLSGHFVDVLRGLPTLVAFRRALAQGTTIRAVTDRYRRASADTLRLAFASSVVLELVATLSVAVVAVCVGLRLAADTLDFRTALIVLLLAPEAYWPLRRVGAEFHAATEGGAALDDAQRMLADPVARGGLAARPDCIALRDVTLGYDGRPVVEGLNVDFGIGLTAVTGPSGCGKSTLLAALVGELRPMSGRIAVGADDLTDVDPDDWRRQVAWAPQRPWLFAGTVADNVRIGRPEATDAEVWNALETAGLAHVVLTLADGIDSPLGEDGAGLSAGERARLVLARVLLADRPVVVLDEPTAHLDAETEQVLLEAVRLLARDRIVVVVAHREAVAAAADRVVALAPTTAVVTTHPQRTAAPVAAPAPDDSRPSRPWAGVV